MSATDSSTDITISYENGELVASPSPFYAGDPGQARVVTWGPGSGVQSITVVTITSKDGGPYTGTQPSAVSGSDNWQWNDPETAKDTYEYTVSAQTDDGRVDLDPEIINTSGG